ncbi:Ribosomal S10 domain containing protein [Trichuris trichiura]|uniref:Small ribosomal subunit protein uS10m n=1 Tax=Trichuris trichiura TaxID=36087 RepID=A0A077ZI30_TRITR|nr:Ribosomal S10 domain containing protein [Trichuris trichiura]
MVMQQLVSLSRWMLGTRSSVKMLPCSLITQLCGNSCGRLDLVRYIRMTREEILNIRTDPPLLSSGSEFLLSMGEVDSSKALNKVESDTLYKCITVEMKGHDRAVLSSYEVFVLAAAGHLGIAVDESGELKPPYVLWRRTLLKSAHVHKSARVQYETRTYRRRIRVVRLTSSTADTFLEYIERNLPEGVAARVIKQEIASVTLHIQDIFNVKNRSSPLEEGKL